MKSGLRTIFNQTIVFLLGCTLLMSCYERQEGCLDSNATNFEVYADDNCCCTYPSLGVNIIKQVDGAAYSATDTFTNALGQRYQIIEQSFYLSNLYLTYADGTQSQVIDTLIRDIPSGSGNEVIIEDNFGLVRQTTPAYTVGSIKENGDITGVAFHVGLTDEIDMLIPEQMPATHPLGTNNASDHYIADTGYVFVRWKLSVIDPIGTGDISLNLSGSTFLKEVALDASITVEPGTVTSLPLVIDYGLWLGGIDFADDILVIESQIATNTVNAFSIQ